MSEINATTIRNAVVDYVSNGNTVPEHMDVDTYVDAVYDMDKLIELVFSACADEDVSPAYLDPDVWVELLSSCDVGDIIRVDFCETDNARRFRAGYRAVLTDDVKNSDEYYNPSDRWVRAELYVNQSLYGCVGPLIQSRLSSLADNFAKNLQDYEDMHKDVRFRSLICMDDGFLDLTMRPLSFDSLSEPYIECDWYRHGDHDTATIPMVIVEDHR